MRASPIAGSGEFAREAIAAGEVLKRLGGRVVSEVEMRVVQESGRPYSALRIDGDWHLLMALDDPASRGNHSCDPNAWLDGPFTVVARRDIAPGDEVTTDYAMMTDDPVWSMACACGARNCRGVVTGQDWRRPDLQAAYRGHFTPHLGRPPSG
ncbi:MAG: SET domain-containing protein-lysine N-methyltransferase [Dehalococcoidia bacterium]